jgi:anaphase-promoting complex subunit 5
MGRHVNPTKVGLLILINFFVDQCISHDAIIPVLSFIISSVMPLELSNADFDPSPKPPPLSFSVHDFWIALEDLETDIGLQLHNVFLFALWKIDSLYAFHEFFRTLEALYVKDDRQRRYLELFHPDLVRLSAESPLGSFVRRAQLDFSRLQIDDTMILFVSFIKFRAPTEGMWRKNFPTLAYRTTVDFNLFAMGVGPPQSLLPPNLPPFKKWLPTIDEEFIAGLVEPNSLLAQAVYPLVNTCYSSLGDEDIDRLLEFQIYKLESKSTIPPLHPSEH